MKIEKEYRFRKLEDDDYYYPDNEAKNLVIRMSERDAQTYGATVDKIEGEYPLYIVVFNID